MPAKIDPGGKPLALVSCGVRQVLWMEFYSVGLYLEAGAPLAAALDAGAPSALRLRVIDKSNFPSHIPGKWRRPLERGLSLREMMALRGAYAELRDGDAITLAYLPGSGVRLRINGKVIAKAKGHALIERMLRVWAGEDPVTGKLREIALEHPC
jgi:hypothetical protein